MIRIIAASMILLSITNGATIATGARNRSSSPQTFKQKTRIGVADFRYNQPPCLMIENGELPPNGVIYLVFPSKPQRVRNAFVSEKSTTSCTADQDAPEGASFYILKVIGDSPSPGEVAIALAGPAKPSLDKRGSVSADLDGDGRKEYFRSCTSSEGVHLTVWSGRPLSGKRVWHSYYYLGYDVEPSCTEKETALSD